MLCFVKDVSLPHNREVRRQKGFAYSDTKDMSAYVAAGGSWFCTGVEKPRRQYSMEALVPCSKAALVMT